MEELAIILLPTAASSNEYVRRETVSKYLEELHFRRKLRKMISSPKTSFTA